MADKQYDISPKMQELFRKKQEQRAAAKEFWKKQVYNPYIQRQPFDPVLFRHSGLSSYSTEYYRSNPRRTLANLLYYSTFFFSYLFVNRYRKNKEAELQSGTISYAQRTNKLLF